MIDRAPNPATLVERVLKLAPLWNPAWKALFEAAATCCPLVGFAGFALMEGSPRSAPRSTKPTLVGALFRKLSATVAGNTSVNIPKPPRTTVLLPEPNGVQEKPARGFTAIAWNPGNAWCWPEVNSVE